MITITSFHPHDIQKGDIVCIQINNGFWKVFYHWIFRINLKRYERHTITSVTNTTLEI